MGFMKKITQSIAAFAVTFGIVIGLGNIPHASATPAQDQAYLSQLQQAGFSTTATAENAGAYGQWICISLALGAPPYPLRDLIAAQHQLSASRAETLMAISINVYCPEAIQGGKMKV